MSIMSPWFLIPLLMLVVTNSAAIECQSKQQCTQTQQRLEAVTIDGMRLTGIIYKRQALNGRYVARFRKYDGFRVVDSTGRATTTVLSSKQFVAALEGLIVRIHQRGGRLDHMDLDMDTVGDTWSDIRVAVRRAVRNGRGPLGPKDKATTQALRGAIRQSKLVRMTCEMVQRHGMACDPRDSFTEQIAFQQKYTSADRGKIALAEDVGLSEQLGFSILFINIAQAPPK